MVVNNQRPFKRLKRRATSDLHDFATFLKDEGGSGKVEPFRTAVKSFVSKYARPPTYSAPLFASLVTWQVAFRVGDKDDELVMDVVEEDVTRSTSVYCNQCRVVGWSKHPVCNKRYHFIIKAVDRRIPVEEEYQQECPSCGSFLNLLNESCHTCGAMANLEELDKLANRMFEDSNFLLHGLIHSNGYGHLLTLNGREGGSRYVSGCDIMNFWDRLCKALFVKKVSVMDVSKKYGTEYRLLHTISEGHTWYGNWGYEFGIGCYGITKEAYCQAVKTLSTMPLSIFCFNRRQNQSHLKDVIQFYDSLSDSKLVTLRDLFSLLFRLIHETTTSNNKCSTANRLCVWTDEDVERVHRGMLKVLMAAQPSSNWVSYKALKGAVFRTASPELIQYCLKHLEGTVSQNGMSVKARYNPTTATVEYRFEGINSHHNLNANRPSREQLIIDMKFLYDCILNLKTMELCRSQTMTDSLAESVSKILDCKQLVKDYKPERVALTGSLSSILVWCQIELVGEPKDDPPTPPQELIILPSNATTADLKLEVAEAFKEVYAMFKMFSIINLPDIGWADDSMTIQLLIGSYGTIRVRGKCDRKCGLSCFRTEKGTESWIVDCVCGSTDDDGEPMLACDACGIWQHTRCVGLASDEDIPEQFTCSMCVNKYHQKKAKIPEVKSLRDSQSHVSSREDSLSSCVTSDKCDKTEASEFLLQSNYVSE